MSDDKKNNAEVRKAYGKATARLREQHRADFDALLAEEYEAAGLTVRRRLTAEERAQRDAAKVAEREQKAAEKRAAKVAALEAELAALKGGDEFAALAEAIESVTTADL